MAGLLVPVETEDLVRYTSLSFPIQHLSKGASLVHNEKQQVERLARYVLCKRVYKAIHFRAGTSLTARRFFGRAAFVTC
jgi:hypothetical protein